MSAPATAAPVEAVADDAWEMVVGLETHVQLATASKMFCGCSAAYDGAEPNTLVCAVCLGLPGSLPVPNERAVEYVVRTGLALGCRIATTSHFDRKNYHYPDLPKGYQITQSSTPLCADGHFEFAAEDGESSVVGIERVHLEEDTAKLAHVGDDSLLDFNRSGVPLIEIVTRPDLRSPTQARDYLEGLRQLLRELKVSTGNMEAGALRADVNISVRRSGAEGLGVKVEVKNLNSFAAVKAALEYERARLIAALTDGTPVVQETRGWSEAAGRTLPQRTKELAEDYRYFPEPDLPPLVLHEDWVAQVGARLPERPLERRRRYVALGLGQPEARLLSRDADTAAYFEAALAAGATPAALAMWITGPLFGLANAAGVPLAELAQRIPPDELAELAAIVAADTLTLSAGKDVLAQMFASGGSARTIIAAEGMGQISDRDTLAALAGVVLADNPEAVADYCGGKQTAIGFLVGRLMRASKGQANPNVARAVLEEALDGACREAQ